jgi:hypothetical protein
MAGRFRREIGLIVAWLVFPLVPVVLAGLYCPAGLDPYDWDWSLWIQMLGPLVGYGFLAGATVDLADGGDAPRRRWRRLLARRSVWIAIGPWCGAVVWITVIVTLFVCAALLDKVGFLQHWQLPEQVYWKGTWLEPVLASVSAALAWLYLVFFEVTWSFGWVWPAWAALRRAAKVGRLRCAFYRGLCVALAFVSSLFGSFWAATSVWRSYFFDPRLMPLILAAACLAMTSGCASTVTYGDVRRRELFHAMLVAWVLGLALMWRWWSRSRPGPPPGGPTD